MQVGDLVKCIDGLPVEDEGETGIVLNVIRNVEIPEK